MKKKGFTLVELLCVIAILAILVIIALPNILSMFNSAKKSSFETELKSVYTAAEERWINDTFSSSGTKIYAHCLSGTCSNELKLNGRDNLEYYIEFDTKGNIVKYYAKDGSYQYSYNGPGLKKDGIVDAELLASLEDNQRINITCNGVSGGPAGNRKITLITDRGSFSNSSTVRSVEIDAIDDDYTYEVAKITSTDSYNSGNGRQLAVKINLAKSSCFTDSSYYRIYYIYSGHNDLLFELKKSDLLEHRYSITNNSFIDKDYSLVTYIPAGFGYNGAVLRVEKSSDITNCNLVDRYAYYDSISTLKTFSDEWIDTTAYENYVNILNNSVSGYHVSGLSHCDSSNNCSNDKLYVQWEPASDITVCYFVNDAGTSVMGSVGTKTCKNYQTIEECFKNDSRYNNKLKVALYPINVTECLTTHQGWYCYDRSITSYSGKYLSELVLPEENGCYAHTNFTVCLCGDMEIEVYDKKKKKKVKKKLKDITYDDLVLAWDFDKGEYVYAEVLWIMKQEKASEYTLLTFSDGSTLKVIGDHRILSLEEGKFANCLKMPIGSTTMNVKGEVVTLVDRKIVYEEVDVCNIITKDHINVYANGILTSRGRNNLYKIENMKFVKEDRETFSREDFPNVSDEYYYGLRLGDTSKNYRGSEEYTKLALTELVNRLEETKDNKKKL